MRIGLPPGQAGCAMAPDDASISVETRASRRLMVMAQALRLTMRISLISWMA